jgi:hypothetical protein
MGEGVQERGKRRVDKEKEVKEYKEGVRNQEK